MSLFATRTTLAYSKSQPSPSHLKLWSHDIVWLWLIAETFYSVIDLTCPALSFQLHGRSNATLNRALVFTYEYPYLRERVRSSLALSSMKMDCSGMQPVPISTINALRNNSFLSAAALVICMIKYNNKKKDFDTYDQNCQYFFSRNPTKF